MVFHKAVKMKRYIRNIALVIVSLALPLQGLCDEPAHKARHYYLDDIGQFVPTIGGVVLSVAGVPARHSVRERLAVTLTSMALCEAGVWTLKHTIHSTRPDGTDRHSFPSGHAARAFRGAEIIRSEFGWGWGAGAYAVAAGVGALRIHHHRHRFGDVAAGAVYGFFSARAAYWLLPLERRIFGWDKSDVTAVAVPVCDPTSRTFGASLAIVF